MSAPQPATIAPTGIEAFLRGLSHTGALGFEGFVTRLMEAETRQRFRIAGSGFQAGMDSISEADGAHANRVKVETKHYFATGLNLRELTAEIVQAAKASDFDLWVLGCTCPVSAQHVTALEEYSEERGVECLFLDRPTAGLARLDVLMAAHEGVVDRFRAASGSTVDPTELMDELRAVAVHPEFSDSLRQLREKLRSTLLGYGDARRRAAETLLRTLADAGNAEAIFNQRVAIRSPETKLVARRALEDHFTGWWNAEAPSGRHCVALGQEGQGKSWALMTWVADRVVADTLPMTLAINASAFPLTQGSTIEDALPELIRRSTGLQTVAYWEQRLLRWTQSDEGNPLILVVVDGLNERADMDWVGFFRPLLHERWRGRVIVLASDRPGHWRPRCSRLERDGFRLVDVPGYTERELADALAGRNIDLTGVPTGLRELLRTPRYCDLVADHFDELKLHADFTRERLVLLDIVSRQERKRGFPLPYDDFLEIIRKLARSHRARAELNAEDIRAVLPGVDPSRQVHQEILDGGLLVREPGSLNARYKVEPTRLVFGLGMLLADDLAQAIEAQATPEIAEEIIAAWLEPHSDADLSVQICASAVFHGLLDPHYPTPARRALIGHWLGSRNRYAEEDEARLSFVLQAPADFLAVAERFWSSPRDRGAAQTYLATAFCLHRDVPTVEPLLAEMIERWMGLVHPDGPPLLRGPRDRDADRLRVEIAGRVGHDLHPGQFEQSGRRLTVIVDDGLLRLKRFALLLLSAGERKPFAQSLVTWAIASAVMGAAMEFDVVAWVARLSNEDLEPDLLPQARRLLTAGDEVSTSAGHTLLGVLGTEAAGRLRSEFPRSPSPEMVRRREEHAAAPCASMFSWSDAECERCLLDRSTPIRSLLTRGREKLLDPARTFPPTVAQRLVEALDALQPAEIHAHFGSTLEDHIFDELLPPLAALAPKALADFIRSIVATMPARNREGRRQLSIWLREIYPLFDTANANAIRVVLEHLRDAASTWPSMPQADDVEQLIEAFATWAMLPHLSPEDRYRELLRRPTDALDLDDMDIFFGPLPPEICEEALGVVRSPRDGRALMRALWLLGTAKASLEPSDVDRIVELADAPDVHVRAYAVRLALLSGDPELCRRVVDLERNYDHLDQWESRWGCALLFEHGARVAFEKLASRMPPVMAGHLLTARGSPADETRAYAAAIDALWQRVTGAPDPSLPLGQPADVRIVDGRKPAAGMPEFVDVDAPGSRLVDASTSWTSPSSGELPGSGATLLSGRQAIDDPQREIDRRRDALLAAWQTPALSAFGHSFSAPAFEAIQSVAPEFIATWADETSLQGPTGRSTRFRLGTFAYALCEALLRTDPIRGVQLWRSLSEKGGSVTFSVAGPLFRAPRSAAVDAARDELLDGCSCDDELARLARAADVAKDGWLEETVERLIAEFPLAKRALGLTLLSFSHEAGVNFDAQVGRALIEGTWVHDALPALRRNHADDARAQQWFDRYLQEADEDRAWASLRVAVELADERMLDWMRAADEEAVPTSRRNLLHMMASPLARTIDRSKDRKRKLFGIKITEGQIMPFI